MRDNRGNEEEVVTKKIGEQGYCVTKKRDSMGREEVKESYNNMDERECHDAVYFLAAKWAILFCSWCY